MCTTREVKNYKSTTGSAFIVADDGTLPACDIHFNYLTRLGNQFPKNINKVNERGETWTPIQWASMGYNRVVSYTPASGQAISLVKNSESIVAWRRAALETPEKSPYGVQDFGFGACGFVRKPVPRNTAFYGEGDLKAEMSHSERQLRDAFYQFGATSTGLTGGLTRNIIGGVKSITDFYIYTTFTPCAKYCSRDISFFFYIQDLLI